MTMPPAIHGRPCTSLPIDHRHSRPGTSWFGKGRLLPALGLLLPLCLGQVFAETNLSPGKGAGPRLGPITKLCVEVPTRGDVDRLAAGGYDLDTVLSGRAVLFVDSDELANLRAAGCKFPRRLPVFPESRAGCN